MATKFCALFLTTGLVLLTLQPAGTFFAVTPKTRLRQPRPDYLSHSIGQFGTHIALIVHLRWEVQISLMPLSQVVSSNALILLHMRHRCMISYFLHALPPPSPKWGKRSFWGVGILQREKVKWADYGRPIVGGGHFTEGKVTTFSRYNFLFDLGAQSPIMGGH